MITHSRAGNFVARSTQGNSASENEWLNEPTTFAAARFRLLRIVWRELLVPAFYGKPLPVNACEHLLHAADDYLFAGPITARGGTDDTR